MSSGRDISGILIGLGFGIGGFFWGFTRLRRKRRIENIPTSTIRGLALGLVELIGKAKKKKVLKSPLTNTDCVLYRYLIERYERRGKSSRWVTIAKGDSYACPFWIDDGTGKIMILPNRAELYLPVDYEFKTGWGRGLPTQLSEFMRNRRIRYKGMFGIHTLRFREWYICENDAVYVLGTAKKTHDFVSDHKDKLSQRLKELKGNKQKMAEVDLNKDGEISKEEWDMAVVKIEEELLEEELKSTNQNDLADVVIAKGEEEKIFIISDHSQKELTKKLGLQAMLGIFGGAVLALAMLWILFSWYF